MTVHLTIETAGDVPNVAAVLVGHHPEPDSLVVISMRDQPLACRVDLTDELDSLIEAIGPGLAQYSPGNEVFILTYGSGPPSPAWLHDVGLRALGSEVLRAQPHIDLIDVLAIQDGQVYSLGSRGYMPISPWPEGVEPVPERAGIVAQMEQVNDPLAAYTLASDAWHRDGDGTRAWLYLDRAIELGLPEADADPLRHALTGAINPFKEES